MNKITNFLGFCGFFAFTMVLSIAVMYLFGYYSSGAEAAEVVFRNWYFGVFGAGTYAFIFQYGNKWQK